MPWAESDPESDSGTQAWDTEAEEAQDADGAPDVPDILADEMHDVGDAGAALCAD